ncbi:hypothetical protein OT109_01295 [Phycisphaeraceae bacterium D3-23]
MPVYLFTFHAYGSWMPDHQRGYTHRQGGVRVADSEMAAQYRARQKQTVIAFEENHQLAVIDELQAAAQHQRFILYAIATDPTHIHVLCGWEDARGWAKLRNGIRESITRMLNRAYTRRRWLAENASRKRVKEEEHFDHLRANYLPGHRGLKWDPKSGVYR